MSDINQLTPPQPLDIQHDTDPAREVPPARRIPHLGHTLLFWSLCFLCILTLSVVVFLALHDTSNDAPLRHPFAAAMAQFGGYVLTLAVAVPLFPVVWQCSFWQGIHWNPRAVQLNWWKLIVLGVLLSVGAQVANRFVKSSDDNELLQLFQTPLTAWTTAVLGSFLAPLMEELAFRGFLLPSLATAYDWLALERTPAGLDRWQRSAEHTVPAWIFATVFSSLPFAVLHGMQNHWYPGPLVVLFVVSACFSLVRIRLRSTAASVLVHMAYNGLLFVEMIVATGGFRHLDKLT